MEAIRSGFIGLMEAIGSGFLGLMEAIRSGFIGLIVPASIMHRIHTVGQ